MIFQRLLCLDRVDCCIEMLSLEWRGRKAQMVYYEKNTISVLPKLPNHQDSPYLLSSEDVAGVNINWNICFCWMLSLKSKAFFGISIDKLNLELTQQKLLYYIYGLVSVTLFTLSYSYSLSVRLFVDSSSCQRGNSCSILLIAILFSFPRFTRA